VYDEQSAQELINRAEPDYVVVVGVERMPEVSMYAAPEVGWSENVAALGSARLMSSEAYFRYPGE
jgi:hypothetical protein